MTNCINLKKQFNKAKIKKAGCFEIEISKDWNKKRLKEEIQDIKDCGFIVKEKDNKIFIYE